MLSRLSDLGPEHAVHWESSLFRVGTFGAGPADPSFESPWQTSLCPTVIFPRERVRVRVTLDGSAPFLADSATAVLYNFGSAYRVQNLGGTSVQASFFHMDADLLAEALMDAGVGFVREAESPFRHTHLLADPTAYALQRLVGRHVRTAPSPDALFIEETLLRAMKKALREVNGKGGWRGATGSPGRRLAERAREAIADRYEENSSVRELASDVGCSVYHLCRVFRAETGVTLHQYRHRLRLSASLKKVAEGADLATVAVDLGYYSHSHFTATFRAAFGMTPSRFRQLASAPSLSAVLPASERA